MPHGMSPTKRKRKHTDGSKTHEKMFNIGKYWCCSVVKSCPTLCDRMDFSMPDSSALHYLLEFVQSHVHWVSDAIQPSHPLLPSSPPVLSLSQHLSLSQWVSGQSIGASASASVLPMNIQGWVPLGWTGLISLQSMGPLRVFSISSSTTTQKHQFFGTQLSFWSNSLTFVRRLKNKCIIRTFICLERK